MAKWRVQKQTHGTAQKHAKHKDVTDIQYKLFILFIYLFIELTSFMCHYIIYVILCLLQQ